MGCSPDRHAEPEAKQPSSGVVREALARAAAFPKHASGLCITDLARDDLAHAQEQLADALSRSVAFGDIALIAASLVGLASVAERREQPLTAARLLGALAAHSERSGVSLQPLEQALLDQTEAALRQHLDQQLVDAAVREGRSLPLDEVVAKALAVADKTANTIGG